MCNEIFVASRRPLATIDYEDECPAFYAEAAEKGSIPEFALAALRYSNYYTVGSFMGCACGLAYGDWFKNNPHEDYPRRRADVDRFMRYLADSSVVSDVRFISVSWSVFPSEPEERKFDPKSIDDSEFELEEDVVFEVLK